MARSPRLLFEGALYHVLSRGNARQAIVLDNRDRLRFLATVSRTVRRYNLLCHAYCLMDNHYHLLLETPDGNLSDAMRYLNGVYSQSFNRRHERTGHVLQGRFRAILVEKDAYLLAVCRYLVLNPVRAGLTDRPGEWPWSSYRAQAGYVVPPRFLTVDWVWRYFDQQDRIEAQRRYRDFVMTAIDAAGESPGEPDEGSVLGSESFIADLRSMAATSPSVQAFLRKNRLLGRPTLAELFQDCASKSDRNARIRDAHVSHGYSMRQIADFLGLHYSTVSRASIRAGQPRG